jgi:gluconate kinase
MYFVHLVGTEELLRHRLSGREQHFMPGALLRSQLDVLEPLEPDEDGVTVDVSGTLPEVVDRALARITPRVRPSPRPRS